MGFASVEVLPGVDVGSHVALGEERTFVRRGRGCERVRQATPLPWLGIGKIHG